MEASSHVARGDSTQNSSSLNTTMVRGICAQGWARDSLERGEHTDDSDGIRWPLSQHDPKSATFGSHVEVWGNGISKPSEAQGSVLQPDILDSFDSEPVTSAIGWGCIDHEAFRSSGYGNVFASVGLDDRLLLWDARVGSDPVAEAKGYHNGEINCVSWSALNPVLLATGAADGAVRVFDTRAMGHRGHPITKTWGLGAVSHPGMSPLVASLEYHVGEILSVEWSYAASGTLVSAGTDGIVAMWDLARSQVAKKAIVRNPRNEYLS